MTHSALNKIQRTMPPWRYVVIACALLSRVPSVSAQQPSTPPPSQAGLAAAEAKSAIDAALKPIGEEQAIRSLDSCVVTGTLKQGAATGTFSWKAGGQEYWAESNIGSIHIVAASNHGRPMRLMNGRAREASKSTLSNTIPLYNVGMTLLRSRDDTTLAVAFAPITDESAAGVQITQAKPKDPDLQAASETWVFDHDSGLPTSHLFKPVTYHGRPLAWTAQYKFSNYHEASGVNVPRHIEEYTNAQFIRSYDIQTFQCGLALSGHDFEVSGDAK